MKIARVFPRRTKATPDDELVFTSLPPEIIPDIDEVHVSVAFTYDMPIAEMLAEAWIKTGVPVKMGGPAFNQPSGEFIPGKYLKKGYVITSRGCPNNCWFCAVPKREGNQIRELPIVDGWNVLDDNLLACSEKHIRDVFSMLKRQHEKPLLTGGLEAKLLEPWHVDLLREAKVQRMYFAYDTPDDYEPLVEAGKLLQTGGITRTSRRAYCYVLIGYKGDTFEKAEKRLWAAWDAGFAPFATLYKDEKGEVPDGWKKLQREWVRPQILFPKLLKRHE
jgi:Fe-S oxidoreductase